MKLWARNWITFRSRRFGSLREETPLVLLSVEKGSIGERDVPIEAKPILRHYMSNVFIYLMPKGEVNDSTSTLKYSESLSNPTGESVHGWELKLGMSLEEAEEFLKELMLTIQKCKLRRGERHKKQDREMGGEGIE